MFNNELRDKNIVSPAFGKGRESSRGKDKSGMIWSGTIRKSYNKRSRSRSNGSMGKYRGESKKSNSYSKSTSTG